MMTKPIFSIIAALGANREIGKNNQLLWNIPEDMKHFRATTQGKTVIMGRKTFESIGRPLPNRTNIVVTRNQEFLAPDCHVVFSLDQAIELAKKLENQEFLVIGGEQLYTQALSQAKRLYLTQVEATFDADSYFPEYEAQFKLVSSRESSDPNYKYRFEIFEK